MRGMVLEEALESLYMRVRRIKNQKIESEDCFIFTKYIEESINRGYPKRFHVERRRRSYRPIAQLLVN